MLLVPYADTAFTFLTFWITCLAWRSRRHPNRTALCFGIAYFLIWIKENLHYIRGFFGEIAMQQTLCTTCFGIAPGSKADPGNDFLCSYGITICWRIAGDSVTSSGAYRNIQ
jgi:hypothetical protein